MVAQAHRIVIFLFLASLCSSTNKTFTITAIQDCIINFANSQTPQKSSVFDCKYFIPGTTVNSTDSTQCYTWCCPGMAIPSQITLSTIQPCVDEFATQPALVWVIGMIIGLLLFFVFFILPCLCSKTGAFSNIKLGVASQEVEQSEEEDIKDEVKAAAKNEAY